MPDYAALARQAEQESAQPSGGGTDYAKLAQQAEMEANAPAPLSGGGSVPIPEALQNTPESNNRANLQSGLIGVAKSVPGTIGDVGGMVNKIPRIGEHIAPRAEVNAFDNMAHPDDSEEQAGKYAGDALQLLNPVGDAAKALPSAERAGGVLSSIAADAAHQPVSLTHVGPALQRYAELATRGAHPIHPVETLLNRSQTIAPMNFPEARDIYSNITRLAGEDAGKMNAPMKAQIGKVRSAFHNDITGAADAVGRGKDYQQAMTEYRRAAQMREGLKKVGIGGGAIATGGGLYETGKNILHRLQRAGE